MIIILGGNMKILVTGGTGYIGSHTCCELLENDFEVVIVDNFFNSSPDVVDKIEEISKKKVSFYEGDVCDKAFLKDIFKKEKIDAVIHFAGYKAVGESVKKPLMYYRNNLDSTITLLEVMQEFGCKKIVFSSSATVYGNPEKLPITEDFPLHTTNPYGTTKLMIEDILKKYDGVKEFCAGGITVTGGEPLVQIDFVTELFKQAQVMGIHTALDTSGLLFNRKNTSKIDDLLKYTSLVLLDIKHINDDEHKKLTILN